MPEAIRRLRFALLPHEAPGDLLLAEAEKLAIKPSMQQLGILPREWDEMFEGAAEAAGIDDPAAWERNLGGGTFHGHRRRQRAELHDRQERG